MQSTFVDLGRLHIPVFGIFAAAGVISALALSQRTARHAKLDAGAVWNAGTTMVVAAFVISRLLLVVFNWHSFLQYPLLVMALPSLTSIGVLLTGLFMVAYLQWRRVPLLRFLDAMAPCAALLWVFLTAGRLADGTRDGMPRDSVWSGGMVMRAPYPVESYTLVSAAMICLVLLWAIKMVHGRAGTAAGIGLGLAAFAIYFIDFFRLPSGLIANARLDPAQAIAIGMVVLGCGLVTRREAKMQRAADQTTTGNEGHDAV